MADYAVDFEMASPEAQHKYNFFAQGDSAELVMTGIVGAREAELQSPVVVALRNLHHPSCQLKAVSVKNLNGLGQDVRRRTLKLAGKANGLEGAPTAKKDQGPDTRNAAIIWRLYASGGGYRDLYISGVPDWFIRFKEDDSLDFQDAVRDALNAFTQACVDADLKIRVQGDTGEEEFTTRRLIHLFEETPGFNGDVTRVTYEAATELLAVGTRVSFVGIKRDDLLLAPYKKGDFPVIGVGTHATLAKPYVDIQVQYAGPDAGIQDLDARIRGVRYLFRDIEGLGDLVDFATRQRGAGSAPRGRESGTSFRKRTR